MPTTSPSLCKSSKLVMLLLPPLRTIFFSLVQLCCFLFLFKVSDLLLGMLLFFVAERAFVVSALLQLSFLVRMSCSITIWHSSARLDYLAIFLTSSYTEESVICGLACSLTNTLAKILLSSETIRQVAQEIIKEGRSMAKTLRMDSPLMFEWYGQRYWGAAHGLAGIMHVLMDVQLNPDEVEDVKGTLKYMIKNRFPSGNYPASEEDRRRDILVHWCHGAPGIALTLVKAAEVFGDREFLEAGAAAAEVVWNRGLLKRVGICHGISGNAYVFLSLYRATGRSEYLYRAKAFGSFLLDRGHKLLSKGEMHGGDSPYSLCEGVAGMAYLFLDMVDPTQARFPGYEL